MMRSVEVDIFDDEWVPMGTGVAYQSLDEDEKATRVMSGVLGYFLDYPPLYREDEFCRLQLDGHDEDIYVKVHTPFAKYFHAVMFCAGANVVLTKNGDKLSEEEMQAYKERNVYLKFDNPKFDNVKMGVRILVTGASGFLGSHLVEWLLEMEDTYVVGLDNLYSSDGENIRKFLFHPRFTFIKGDVVDLPSSIYTSKFTHIYHLACPASPKYYQLSALKTLDTCYIGTKNILDLALSSKARVLFTSTSEVYGDPLEHPQKESYRGNVSNIGPRACYDIGKCIGETLCSEYHRQHNLEVRIARIFNTYGPRMKIDDGRVVSNFIVKALQKQPIPIYGDGSQSRSFCFVSDTIRGLIALMHSDVSTPVNIGNPNEVTIRYLAKQIMRLVDHNIESGDEFTFKDLPVDDPTRRNPDITKAKTELDWEPCISLQSGLVQTINYFKTIT